MAIWEKLNPRERQSAIGAGLLILGWLVSLTSYGLGAGTLALLGALAVAAILYLKSAPNSNINWPAPPSLLIFAIGAVVALLVLIDVLTSLRYVGLFGATAILALVLEAIGAALMVWGAWQEYQIVKPPMPNWAGGTSTGDSSTPPPPARPATAPDVDTTDEAPPV